MKEFIKDDNKIRYCDFNISKMNIWEFYWHFDRIDSLKKIYHGYLKSTSNLFVSLFELMTIIFATIFFPIAIMIRAKRTISHSKKNCAQN